MPKVHPSAVVSSDVQMHESVEIGPYVVVEAGAGGVVRLGEGVTLASHSVVRAVGGPVEIGAGTRVSSGAVIGGDPQDFKFAPGSPSAGVRVGAGCIIREHVTIHMATKLDAPTTIGDRVLMMASSHAGHDATVGHDVILANGALLAGHSKVGDRANISGCAAIHQFNRVGRLGFVSGGSAFSTDVPPFCVGWGRNRIHGVNLIGLRRTGVPREHIRKVLWAFVQAFRPSLPKPEVQAILDEMGKDCPPVAEMAEFVRTSKRPISPGVGRPSREMVALWRAIKDGRPVEAIDDEPAA